MGTVKGHLINYDLPSCRLIRSGWNLFASFFGTFERLQISNAMQLHGRKR